MAKNRDDKKGSRAGEPAPPPSSRARLPSRLRRKSATTAGTTDPKLTRREKKATVGTPSLGAPPSHRHMSTMGYEDTGAHLPTVTDPTSFPDRMRQTSLSPRPTMSSARSNLPGVALAEVIDAAALDADESVELLVKICQVVQQHHNDKKSVGRLTPRHIRLVPNAQGAVTLLTGDEVPVDPGYDVLYEAPEAGGLIKVRKRAPEREDVYALGCIGFEIFTGRAPFVGASPADIRNRRSRFAVPAARQVAADAELLPAVEVQIQKALKKRSGDRHANAGDLADGLLAANVVDDRSTMALGAEQAELLQELLASKTANVQANRELEEEKKRLAAELKDAEAAKVRAAEQTAQAEAKRKEAVAQTKRAAAATTKAREESEEAATKSKTGMIMGVLALLLAGGGVGGFILFGQTAAPVVVVAADAGSTESADTGEVDTGVADTGTADTGEVDTGTTDTGEVDTGAVDTGEVDTGPVDAGTKAKTKHRRRPRLKLKPKKPKLKPKKPVGGPVVF